MLMKERAVTLEDLFLTEFLQAGKEEDVLFFTSCRRNLLEDKGQENVCEELVSWHHIGLQMGDDSELRVLIDSFNFKHSAVYF